MRYLPHTQEEIAEMLTVTGQHSLDALFAHIPEDLRYRGEIDIPGPLSEWELTAHLDHLGRSMFTGSSRAVLIGAGSYHHHIPEIVRSLSGRSEFLTSYTPYQPEMAQGTLQGIFEFQTLTARLLGTEVANDVVHHMGITFVSHLMEMVGASVEEIVRAYMASAACFQIREQSIHGTACAWRGH